ncbi:hypothetical protein [Paraburkholderia strydomiana]|jgi:hypothetical protein|uniref:HTH luxR-type domain-containing protein n=1 Tax=Paraburkholderia strydomiana TaxID=1245417 RepID=A0ABW9BTV9_9BURK
MEPILLQHLLNNWSDLSRREAQIVGCRLLNLPSAKGAMLNARPCKMAEIKHCTSKHFKPANPT